MNIATETYSNFLNNISGTYPSPKACASMVVYKDSLVLYGGWSRPTPMPLHQVWLSPATDGIPMGGGGGGSGAQAPFRGIEQCLAMREKCVFFVCVFALTLKGLTG